MLEFIHTSDWHCSKLKNLFPEDHVKITLQEVRKPLEYAVKNGIKVVIHSGDLFDKAHINHIYIKALINLFLEFKDLSIYIILGNHDYEDVDNNSLYLFTICNELGILPNVRIILEQIKLKIEKVPFNFMPYPCQDFSKKHVNISHLEITGAVRDNNRKIKFGIKPKGINFIGHIHKKQRIKNSWFCGGLFQTTFGESNPKGWFHVQIDAKEMKPEVKFIKNNCSFELINVYIETQDDFANLVKDKYKLLKLHIAEGMVVPAGLTNKYPNIVDIVGKKNGEQLSLYTKELPVEMYEGSNVVDDLLNDPLWGLRIFLKKEGLSKKERKRGIEIVKELMGIQQ